MITQSNRKLRLPGSLGHVSWVPVMCLIDAVIGGGSMLLAFRFSSRAYHATLHNPPDHISLGRACLLMAVTTVLVRHLAGFQRSLLGRWKLILVIRALCIGWAAVGLTVAISYAVLYSHIGRVIVLELGLLVPLGLVMTRLGLWWIFAEPYRKVAVLGDKSTLAYLQALIANYGAQVSLVEPIRCPLQDPTCGMRGKLCDSVAQCTVVGGLTTIKCDEVVDALGLHRYPDCSRALLQCISTGATVTTLGGFVEKNFGVVPVEYMDIDWFVHAGIDHTAPIYHVTKRAMDVLTAFIGLLLTAPIILLSALVIKATSRGPVLYSQTRCGHFGKPFIIWKLRTMYLDSEKQGPQWATQRDPRVTRVGRFLRLSRLDEVPQLWNILVGEMSLVGPRPERPEFMAELSREIRFYEMRHLVKPGLTGWAQVNYPYGSTVEDSRRKLGYDLYYLKHASLAVDVQIAIRTLAVAAKGAR